MSKVLTAIDKSKSFRVYLTITTDMVETARAIHMTSPLATAGLGRVLTAAGIMGIMLKNPQDKLTLIIKGDGPAKQILATADGDGNVKGYIANPDVELPLTKNGKLDVGGSIGIGDLTVIKDMGLKEPYMGTIALVNGEIAEDLTAYFFISEQQNTSVALGVKIERDYKTGAAGGMIIQMLPGAEEGAVDALEDRIAKWPPLTSQIDEVCGRCAGKSQEELVRELMREIFREMPEEYAIEPLECREIRWNCDCSEERMEKALMSIGKEELTEILKEDGQAELQCQFCLKKYQFDKAHLERILEEMQR